MRPDGYILTNHHVIADAEQVSVELTDGRRYNAEVVGSDAPSDLAVLKIDAQELPALTLGNSDAVRVGDVVLAVGNPLGVGQTVTMGIVSAKGRATGGAGDGSFEDFIQTDAPINRGNSGGALVSTRGELSIPSNMARNIMTQLIDNGQVRRGMLGVNIQGVTSDLARSLGLRQVQGALVSGVQPGSPAEKGGVRRGDVITAIDGEPVRDGNGLRNRIAQMGPDSTVQLTIVRGGAEQQVAVTLSELQVAQTARDDRDARDDTTGFGMGVEPLTPATAKQLGVNATSGLVVRGVEPAGRAAATGLRAGDVIEEADGTAVQTVEALRAALRTGDRPALLLVHRADATIFMTLERGQS